MKDIQVDAINKNKPQGKTVPVAPVYFTGEEEKEPIKTPSINQEFPKPPNEFDTIKEDISKGNIPIELIPKPKPIEYNLKANSGGLEFQETDRKRSDVARFYQNKKETIENNTNDFNQKLLNEMYSSGAINISPDGSIEYDTQKGEKLLNDYAKFFTETNPAYKKYFAKFAAPFAGLPITLNDLGGVPIVGILMDAFKDEELDDNVVAFDRSYKQISNMLRQFDNWNKTYGKARGTNKININDMDTAELVGATLFDSIKKFASGMTMGATEFIGDIDPTGLATYAFSPIHSDIKEGITQLTRLTQQYPDIYKEEAQGLEALNKGLYNEGWIALESIGSIAELVGAMHGAGGFKLGTGMIEKLSAKLSPLLTEKAAETTQRVVPKLLQMFSDGTLEGSMGALAHRESMVANTLNIFKKVFGGGANFAGMKVPGMNMTFGSLPKYTTVISVSSIVNNLVKYDPSTKEEEIIENFRDMAILGVLNYGAGALMSKVGQSLSLINAGLKGLKIPPQELIAKQTRNAILGMGLGNIAAGTPATLVSTYISTGKLLPEQDEFMNKYSPLGENHVLLMDAFLNAAFGLNDLINTHSFNRHLKGIKDTRKYINDYTEIVKKETPLGENFNKPNYEPLKLNQGGNKETTQKEYDWSKGVWQDVTRRESTFYEVAKKNAANPDNIKVDDLISTYNKIKKQDVTSMSNDIFNKVLDSIRDYTIKETPEDNPNKVSVDTKNKILFLDNNVNHSITDSNWYDENMILRSVTPEERVARTILHEGMHALTANAYEQGLKETNTANSRFAKAMDTEYDRFVKKYFDVEQSNGELIAKNSYKNLDKASKQAIDYIVKQGDHSTQVKEFMAMITDPIKSNEVIRNSIRDDSKGTSIFSKVQEKVDKLFGIDKSLDKYYDKLNELEVGKDVNGNDDILGMPEVDDERVKYVDMGKFSREDRATGTPADIEMRKVADGFIGEAKAKGTSTATSFYDIESKLQQKEGVSQGNGAIAFEQRDKFETDFIQRYEGESGKTEILGIFKNPKVVMLARNKEFYPNDINDNTKGLILQANNQGASFVVGNSYIDKPFIDYLDEIGAKYTIYGHKGRQGGDIIPEQSKPIETIKGEASFDKFNQKKLDPKLLKPVITDYDANSTIFKYTNEPAYKQDNLSGTSQFQSAFQSLMNNFKNTNNITRLDIDVRKIISLKNFLTAVGDIQSLQKIDSLKDDLKEYDFLVVDVVANPSQEKIDRYNYLGTYLAKESLNIVNKYLAKLSMPTISLKGEEPIQTIPDDIKTSPEGYKEEKPSILEDIVTYPDENSIDVTKYKPIEDEDANNSDNIIQSMADDRVFNLERLLAFNRGELKNYIANTPQSKIKTDVLNNLRLLNSNKDFAEYYHVESDDNERIADIVARAIKHKKPVNNYVLHFSNDNLSAISLYRKDRLGNFYVPQIENPSDYFSSYINDLPNQSITNPAKQFLAHVFQDPDSINLVAGMETDNQYSPYSRSIPDDYLQDDKMYVNALLNGYYLMPDSKHLFVQPLSPSLSKLIKDYAFNGKDMQNVKFNGQNIQMTAKDRFDKILDNLTEDRFWKSLDSDSVFDYDYQTRKLVMEKGEMSIPLYQLIDLEKVNNLLQKNSDFGIKDIIKDSKANYLTDAKLSKELALAGNIFFKDVLPKFKKYIIDYDNQQRDLYFYKNATTKEGIAHFQKLLNAYIYGDSFDSAQSFPFATIDKAKKSVTKYQGVFKTNNAGFSDVEDVCSALKIDINDKENLDNNLRQEMLYYNPKDKNVYTKHTNFDIAEMSRLGIDVAWSNLGTGDIMDNEKATDGTGFLTQRTNWTRILSKSDNADCFQSRYYENDEFGHLTFKGVFENIGSNQLAIPLLDKLNKAGVLLVSTKSLSKGKNVKKLRFVTNLDNDNIRFGINKENNPVVVETKAGTNPDGSPQYKRLPTNEEDAMLKEYWVNKLNGILPAWSVSNINLTGKNSFKVIGSDKKAKIDKFTSQLANVPGSADIINNINNMEKNNKNIRTQYARDLAAVHRAITDIMQNKPLTTDLFNSASKGFVGLVTRLKADDDVNFDKFGITYSNLAEFVNRSYNTETGHVIPSELAKLAFIPDFIFNQWHNTSINTQIKGMIQQEVNDYIMNRYSHSGIHSKLSNGIGKKYTFDLLLNKTNSPLKDNPELKQQFYDQYFDANGSLKAYTNGVILSRDVFDLYKNHIKQYNRNHSDKLPELEVGSKIIVSFMPADTMQEFMGGVLVGIDDYRTCSINAATATKICGKDYDGDGITIAMPSETMSLNDYNEIHKYLSDSQLYNKPKTELEGLLKRQLEIDELGNSVLGSEVGIPTELKYYKAHLSKEKIGNIAKLRTIPGVAWRNIIEAMIRDGKFNASREVYEPIVSHNTNNSVDNYNQNTFNKDLFLQKALFKQQLDGKVVKGIFEAYNSLRKQAKAKNSNLFDLLKASVYDKTQAKDIIKDLSQIRTDYFPKDAEKNKLLFQKKVFNSTFGEPKTDYLKEGGLLANVYTQIFFAESKRGSLIGDFSPRLYKNMDNEFTRARIAGLGTYINFLYNNNCLKNFSDYQILGEPFNPIRYANGKIILPNGTNYNINQLFTSNGMFANKEIASLFYNGELTHKQLENLFDIKKKFFYNDKLDLLKSMLINAVKQFQEPNKIAGELLTEMNTAKRSDAFYRDIMTKGENINDYPNMYNLFLIANEMEDNGISPLIDGITWKDKFDSAIREHTNLSSGYLAMPEFTAIINSNIVSFKPKEIVKNLRDDAGKLPSSLKSFITKPLPQWTQSNLDTFMRDAVLPIIDNYKSYLPKHLSDAEKDKIIEDMISKYSPDSDNYILKEFAKNPNLEGKSKYQEIAMQMRTAQMLTDLERAFIPNAKYSKKKAMINPFSKAYVERLWKDFTTNPIICSKDEVILKSSKGEYTLRDIIDPSTMTQKEIHKLPFMQRYLFEPLKLMQDKIFASTTQVGEINANYSQTREAVMKSGGKDNIDSLKDYAGKFLPFQKDVANELTELAEMIIYWKEQLDNNKDLQELAFGNNYTTTFDKVYEDFIALRDILLDDRGADRLGRKFIYSEENVEALYSAVNEIKEQGYKNYIKPMQDAWQSIEKMGEDYQFIEKRIDENGKEVISNRKNEIKRIYAQVNQFINKEVRENSTYYRNEDGTWITDNIYNAVLSKTNDLVSNFFNPEGNYGGNPVYMKDGQEYIFTLDDANKLVDKIVNDYAGEKGLFYRSQEVSPTRIYYDKMKELVEKYNYKFKTNIFGDNSEMFSKEFHLLTQEEKRILGNIAKHTILNSVNSYIDGLKIKVNQKQVLNSENGVSEGKIKDLVSLEQEIMERVPFEDIVEMFMIDPNNPNPNIMTMDYRNVLDTIQSKMSKGMQDLEGACRFIYSMKPENSDLNNLVMDLFSASTSNFYTSINKQDLELNGNGSYDGTNGIYTGDLLNIQHYNNRGQAIDSYGYIVGKVDRPVYDNKDNLIDKIPTLVLVRQPNKDTNYEYSIQYINFEDISGALKGRSDTWTMKRKNEAFRDGIGANSDEFLKALVEDKSFAIKKATINYHLADEAGEYGYYPRNVNYSGAMSSDVTAEYFNMIDKIDKPYKRNFMEKMDYFQTWRNYLGGKGIMQFFKGMGELVYGGLTGYVPFMALGVANMFHGVVHPSVRYKNAWMNNSLGANTGGFRYSPFESLGKTLSILWKGLEASAEGDTVTTDERMKIGAAVRKGFTGDYGIYNDLTKDIHNEKIKDALSHAVHVLKSKENNKQVEEVKQLFKQIAIETTKIDPETGQIRGFNILQDFKELLGKYDIDIVPLLKDTNIDPSLYAIKYKGKILSEAELIERIRLADVMTDMLYTKDMIMRSEANSYDNSIRTSHNLIAKFGNLSNAKMSLQLKTEISRYLTDISIGKFNNKPSYMTNSPLYKFLTKFRPYSYFKTIDLVLGVPEQIGYYKDLLGKMENDKEFLARYEKITGGILPLQDWFLAKPSAKMTNAAITIVTDLIVHGGFKIATSWLMKSVAGTSMYLIASGALNQEFIEDLSDSGFVPDVFSTMLMSMVFFMEMLKFGNTNEDDLTEGDKVLESASRRATEKGVGTLGGAGIQTVMQQLIGGIYYAGGMADKLDYSAKKSMDDRNRYVITNTIPGATEIIEANTEYKKAQEYEAKQNKANATPVVLPPPPPPDDNAKKPRTNTKSVRKNNNSGKKPR